MSQTFKMKISQTPYYSSSWDVLILLYESRILYVKGQKRITEEELLLSALPQLPDLQCAWLLLYFSAVPRANHLLRAVPPTLVRRYAHDHDKAVWTTLLALLNQKPSFELTPHKGRAQLPCRLGGLGLRNSVCTEPAAYCAE